MTPSERFRPVYQYLTVGGRPQEEELFDEELWNERGIVYARVFQEEIVYIRSTESRLCDRIQEHFRIIWTPDYSEYREWAEGKRIMIFAYKPPLIEVLGRLISIHRTLENALIAEFRPRFAVPFSRSC